MSIAAAIVLVNVLLPLAICIWRRKYAALRQSRLSPAITAESSLYSFSIAGLRGTARRRRRVQRIWARRKDKRTSALLARLLSDRRQPSVLRSDCAALLLAHGAPFATDIAIDILGSRDEDGWLIARLIQLAGIFGGREFVSPLLSALRRDELPAANAAEISLRQLASREFRGVSFRETVIHALVLSIRNSRRPWNYGRHLRILVELERAHLPFPPSSETVRMLITVMRQLPLDNPYAVETASMAAEALGELGAHSALPELERLVHVDCDLLRYKVVTALGLLGNRTILTEIGYLASKDQIGRIKSRAIDAALAINEREPRWHPALP